MLENEDPELADLLKWICELNKSQSKQTVVDFDTGQVGNQVALKTPGRNSPCPCGSGKKFKKCCGEN